jgi:hypothetical protein
MQRPCHARNLDGSSCRAQAIKGGSVCGMHGGRAKHVRAAAGRRLLEEMVGPALARLRQLIDSADSDATRLQAAKLVLDYCGFKVAEKIELGGKQVIEIEFVAKPLPAAGNGHVLEGRR